MPKWKIFPILFAIGCGLPFFHGICIGSALNESDSAPEISLTADPGWTQSGKTDPTGAALLLAETRLKQGLWQDAAQFAQLVISRDSQNSKAHGILGTIYALGGQKKIAEGELALLNEKGEKSFYGEIIETIFKAQAKEFREAEQHLGLALQKEPEHPVALYYSGSMNLAQNNLEKAGDDFQRVIASYPDFSPALAGMGQVCLRQKKTQNAIIYYQKAIDNDPENLLFRRQLIDIYNNTDQKEAASKALVEYANYTPGIKERYIAGGLDLLSKGSYQEALQLADKILGIYKRLPAGYYIKAVAQINLGQEEKALDNINRFLNMGFGIPQTHHEAGMCFLALGKTDEAYEQFKNVIFLDPKNGVSFIPMTIIEQIRGNDDRALHGLMLTQSQGESGPFVHYLMANIFLSKGDKSNYQKEMAIGKEMVPGLKLESLDFFPEKEKTQKFAEDRNLMMIFFLNRWYDKAIQESDSIIKMYNTDLFAWYYKGLSEMAQGKYRDASNSFDRTMHIAPDLLSGQMNLGRAYSGINAYQNAIAAFTKVIEINPSYSAAYMAIGDVYLQTKEEKKAILSYREVIKLTPDSPEGYQRLAFVLSEQTSDSEEALKFAMKAVELAPENPFSIDVLGWINVRRGEVKKASENWRKLQVFFRVTRLFSTI